MKVSIINGSPKAGKSTSELLIQYFLPFIRETEAAVYNVRGMDLSETQLAKIQNSDAAIFVFPLYIDSLPSHLLRFLIQLGQLGFCNRNAKVYCIINNGFFEGRQNRTASSLMKNWCKAAGLMWGQAVGVGAGEMLPFLKDIPLGHGPNKNLGKALRELARNVLSQSSGKDLFLSPNWPRFLWKLQASWDVWYPRAKQNGVKKKQLKDKTSV